MKKAYCLLLVMMSVTAMGQITPIELEDKLPTRRIDLSVPAELRLVENGWGKSGGPYTKAILFALIAEMMDEELGQDVGSSTREILDEGAERDALVKSQWVKKDTPRLQKETQKVPEYAYEITTGGSSNSRTPSYQAGRYSLSTETGSSSAYIAITIKDLTTNTRIATLIGRAKYSSTNVNHGSIERLLANIFRVGSTASYRSGDRDGQFRRGMEATARALQDLRGKLHKLKTTSREGSR